MEAVWLRIVGGVLFLTGLVVVYPAVKVSMALMTTPSTNGMEAAGFAMAQSMFFQSQAPRTGLALAFVVIGAVLYGFGAVVAAVERVTPPS